MNSPNPTAVLLLGFNRPDLFQRVVEAVQLGGRRDIFVSIDGPRDGKPGDMVACDHVRRIANEILWANRLHIKYEEKNLGCGLAVSTAISWALAQVPEIIVVEDDCLPDPSFLTFCDQLLERYRHDERVMHISGTNWGASAERYLGCSYAFTSFAPIWGWATWRRAWELYDFELESWPRLKNSGLGEGMAVSKRFRRLLEKDWEMVRDGRGTWDHQWQYTVLRHHGLCVSPARNLVVNTGFRADGTQTKGSDRVFSDLPMGNMTFPLKHPPEVVRNVAVESVFERVYWQKLGWPGKVYKALLWSRGLRELARPIVRRLLPRPS